MATTTLNASSTAFARITNRTRAELYKVSSPTALYASIIDTTTGHPARSWGFVGLDRTNYYFQITEIDNSGNIISILSQPMSVVPDNLAGALIRATDQIQVGVTSGLVAGGTSATFDGTAGAPDYRGWVIRPAIIGGSNFMILGVEYSYNSVTGMFSLLQAGDIFANLQYYNITFDPLANIAGGSTPTTFDLTVQLITANITLSATDIGKQFIVEPSGTYMEITFPAISNVVDGRETHFDVSPNATIKCVKFLFGSDTVNFLDGNVFILPNESFTVYKFTRSAGVYEWRIKNANGNFKTVGEMLYSDKATANTYNMVEANGVSVDTSQYARLYNEFVLNLPANQVCNYDVWVIGTNKYKFSLANSANPTFLNKFMIPDRRNLFTRSLSASRIPSEYEADGVGIHDHIMHGKGLIAGGTNTGFLARVLTNTNYNGGGRSDIFGNNNSTLPDSTLRTSDTGNPETTVKNFSARLYILI